MDLLDHLTEEHRTAEELLSQLEDTEPGAERDRLIAELDDALRTHMGVEERFLYPIVREIIGDDDAAEAENEHQLARDGLQQLTDLSDEGGFGAAVEMLKAGIQHHVEEEEGEMFPQLRERAGDQLAELDPEQLEAQVRAGGSGDDGPTKAELYERAKEADVEGRSTMSKDELAAALDES
jgi:hemerythrin-like domain-containing protein